MSEKEGNRNEIAASEQIPLGRTTEERPVSEDKKKEKTGFARFEELMKERGIPTQRMERKGMEIIFHPKPRR